MATIQDYPQGAMRDQDEKRLEEVHIVRTVIGWDFSGGRRCFLQSSFCFLKVIYMLSDPANPACLLSKARPPISLQKCYGEEILPYA